MAGAIVTAETTEHEGTRYTGPWGLRTFAPDGAQTLFLPERRSSVLELCSWRFVVLWCSGPVPPVNGC